jgi:DNA-binding response OmpR family regulator
VPHKSSPAPQRPQEPSALISFHDLRLDPERMEVFIGDVLLKLTASEFKILMLLAGNPARFFPDCIFWKGIRRYV